MPAKNSVKIYSENTFYHVYNRGTDKRVIFIDSADYEFFLFLIKYFLSPEIIKLDKYKNEIIILPNKGYLGELIEIHAFILMPNHFHFLFKQLPKDGITIFMRKLATTYTMYFNKKYERSGSLYQGIFKAVKVDNDQQFIHLTRYIHRNSIEILRSKQTLENYKWSSYPVYLSKEVNPIIKTNVVNQFFKSLAEYKQFVEYEIDDNGILEGSTLE